MNFKRFPCAVGFIVTILVAASCFAEEKDYFIPTRNEELYGIWINETYTGLSDQKWVLSDWGYCEAFNKATDTIPKTRWTNSIVDKWTDAEGNIWYKVFEQAYYGGSYYAVYKIGNDNKVLECTWKRTWFPSEDDLNLRQGGYRIYYRQ